MALSSSILSFHCRCIYPNAYLETLKSVGCSIAPQARIAEEDLSHMSPYITEQIKRFGEYVLDLARRPANLQATRNKFLFKVRDEELESVA